MIEFTNPAMWQDFNKAEGIQSHYYKSNGCIFILVYNNSYEEGILHKTTLTAIRAHSLEALLSNVNIPDTLFTMYCQEDVTDIINPLQ